MNRKNCKTSVEGRYQISADYRRHYEVMRDSSVTKKAGMGFHCPTLMDIVSALDLRHPDAQERADRVRTMSTLESLLIVIHDDEKRFFVGLSVRLEAATRC